MNSFIMKPGTCIRRVISLILTVSFIIGLLSDTAYAKSKAVNDNTMGSEFEDEVQYSVPEEYKGLEYALFASSKSGESFYVNTAMIGGSVHTNGSFLFNGNAITVTEVLESAN
ncbi:MAG: hypothetical protein J5517_10180, partial [Eubacterium sp.]|nr:hypothetical protein [Eubacterium sp.]